MAKPVSPVKASTPVRSLLQIGLVGVRDTFSQGCLEVLFETSFTADGELGLGDEDGLELGVVHGWGGRFNAHETFLLLLAQDKSLVSV